MPATTPAPAGNYFAQRPSPPRGTGELETGVVELETIMPALSELVLAIDTIFSETLLFLDSQIWP
jgi:hypothetical protein